jgi:CheY-like chemotaxis protein
LQPINAAKLTIKLLEQDARGGPSEAHIDRLDRAFQSTEQILHALLDISRLDGSAPGSIRKSQVDLGVIMQRIYEDQRPLAEQKGVSLRYVPCSVTVETDPTYLLRSLQNMVVNAIKFNRAGGRVLMGCRRRGGTVQMQVVDDGPGIAPEDQTRIFEEFARAASAGETDGLGLGLSVVERACRLLEHKLWMTSELGRGALFYIEMPATWHLDRSPRLLLTARAQDALPWDVIAMVIENDADVLASTVEIVERWGASVLAAQSPAEAVALTEEIGMAPDIILADYQLEDEATGLDMIARLRAMAGRALPAILITADRNEDLFEACNAQGVTLLTKPVQLAQLRATMEAKLHV